MLEDKRRFSYEELKHLFLNKYEGRKQRQPVKKFSLLPDFEKDRFLEISKAVKKIFPLAECYAFGSRVNGNCCDDSDYDVVVRNVPRQCSHILSHIEKTFGADLKFANDRFTESEFFLKIE